jgi:MFS family permease
MPELRGGVGVAARARAALRSPDFSRLVSARYVSQSGDGLFQAYIFARLVFLNTDNQSTAASVAKAVALLIVPFSLIGPFAGVFIDRWSRRLILVWTPVLKAAFLVPLLFVDVSWVIYALSLVVVSANRFYLTTAGAVTPSLVSDNELLVGNAITGSAGTVITASGLAIGSRVAGHVDARWLIAAAVVLWPVATWLASRIANPLRAERPASRLRDDLARVVREFVSGGRRLFATPPALAAVSSVFYDQMLINTVAVLSIIVFKDKFKEGIASYSNIVVAAGFGVLAGMITVGFLESRLNRQQTMALAFGLAGVASLLASLHITGVTILVLTFVLAMTFPWRKTPADTLVQESLPNRYRGRIFALQDIAFTMPRVFAALILVLLYDVWHLSVAVIVAIIGVLFVIWPPVLLAWVRRPRYVRVRFVEGGRAEETPRALVVGGEEEPVELVSSSLVERDGQRLRRFRLRGAEETFDVTSVEGGTRWRVEREVPVDIEPEPEGSAASVAHRTRRRNGA